VICLQELSSGFDDLRGLAGEDQFAALPELFPEHHVVTHAVVDLPGPRGRCLFGNALLSRWPIGQVLRHQLPWASLGGPCMARGLLEVMLLAPWGPLRVMTTHLEWSSPLLRQSQVAFIRDALERACLRHRTPPEPAAGGYRVEASTTDTVLCGDFNMTPDDPLVAAIQAPFAATGVPEWTDAWRHRHGDAAHPLSMCLFGGPPGEPPRCLDYIFLTSGLLPALRQVDYNQDSQASDHQPVLVTLQR
jgi:endonuclease/exonuclease/phosphatase family metal-dependent hydrolase